MAKPLVAFHGDAKIKTKYLKRVEAHYKADEIAKGFYWENGKGCAVGCTVEKRTNAHEAMQEELGIPVTVAYLEDRIFEGLPNDKAKEFPSRFLKAIKTGADLSLVTPRFMVWLMQDAEQYAGGRTDVISVVRKVASLYQRISDGGTVAVSEWQAAYAAAGAARAAARAAADAAADAAAYAAAYAAARAAAYAADAAAYAADAAADAAYAAADAAARAAAYAAAYERMADKLIKLLSEAK